MSEQDHIETSPLSALLDRITPMHLALGLGAIALLSMILGTCAAYSNDAALPPPLPAPPKTETEAVLSYRFKESFYRALVDEDCDKLKIGRTDLATLKQPNAHRTEFTGAQRLSVGRRLSTTSLSMQAVKKRLWIGEEGQSLRAPHLVLRITNSTDRHLAFRVKTKADAACRNKGVLPHNALALAPGQRVSRTECMLRSAKSVVVENVEVLELTPLGFHYVSRLDPERLHLDARATEGHDFAGQKACRLLPWRAIRAGLERGTTQWVDVIDFYSRHNCDEYTFSVDYRFARDGLDILPVRPKRS